MEVQTTQEFWNEFNQRVNGIREKLSGITEKDTNIEQSVYLLKDTLVALQVFATEFTDILPSYDGKRVKEEIASLAKDIKSREQTLIPKKKFRFSRNKCSSILTSSLVASSISSGQDTTANVPTESVSNSSLEGSVLVVDRANEIIDITDGDFARADCNGQLLVQRCKGCTVRVLGVAGSIRLEGLVNCSIYLAPCRTSVYIDTCSSGIFHVACHQLRIHKTSNSEIYARCKTHPIIEDCSSLGFGPYLFQYRGVEPHFEHAGLRDAISWDNVVDFRWHRTTQSPNWYVIPETKRVRESYPPEEVSGLSGQLTKDVSIDNNSDLNAAVACSMPAVSVNEIRLNKKSQSVEEDEDEL